MIDLDAATFCLQWATGGLLFLWVTTRERQVGIGYGWLMRASFGTIAAIGVFLGFRYDDAPLREIAGIGVVVATTVALVVSIVRRRAGVAGERERIAVRSKRITEMTGIDRDIDGPLDGVPEFPPALDLIAPLIGIVGLVIAAADAGGPLALSLLRIHAGAAFLGADTGTWSSPGSVVDRSSISSDGRGSSGRSRSWPCCCPPGCSRCSPVRSTTATAGCWAGSGRPAPSRPSDSCS
jgi:hypothetical protein